MTNAIDDNANFVQGMPPVAFWRRHAVTKTNQSAETTFTVVVHPRMLSQLEACFNPQHFYEALTQLHSELPKVHRRHAFWRRWNPVRLRDVYVGRFARFELTFTYVQSGYALHVLHLGTHKESGVPRRGVDTVIGLATQVITC